MIKVRLQVERDNLKGDAVELTRKLEDEHSLRNDLEDELQRLRKGKKLNSRSVFRTISEGLLAI